MSAATLIDTWAKMSFNINFCLREIIEEVPRVGRLLQVCVIIYVSIVFLSVREMCVVSCPLVPPPRDGIPTQKLLTPRVDFTMPPRVGRLLLQPLGRICDLLDASPAIEPPSEPAYVDARSPAEVGSISRDNVAHEAYPRFALESNDHACRAPAELAAVLDACDDARYSRTDKGDAKKAQRATLARVADLDAAGLLLPNDDGGGGGGDDDATPRTSTRPTNGAPLVVYARQLLVGVARDSPNATRHPCGARQARSSSR